MGVRVRHLDKRDSGWDNHLTIPFPHTTSITKRCFAIVKPGYNFKVEALNASARVVAGSVVLDAAIAGPTEDLIITAGALAIDTVPEKFKIALTRHINQGKYVEKAAETAIVFTAAHVVTALKHGIILVQMTAAGVVSTKVPAATPTTAMAYNTAGAALAALPSADSGNIAIGYITIEADAGNWVANTDDMTDAGDLTAATFVTNAATWLSPLASALTVATANIQSHVAGHETKSRYRGTEDQSVYLMYTTDGSGALTDPVVQLVIRPYPLAGDGAF